VVLVSLLSSNNK